MLARRSNDAYWFNVLSECWIYVARD